MKRKQFCSKKCMFISCGIWECFSYSCRQCFGRFVKISLCMFRWKILQVGFKEILSVFHHFRNSSKKFLEFRWENFGRVVTTAFYMYIGTFWGKLYFSKNSYFFYVVFGIWPAILWIFREIFLLASSKMHSPLLENHFWWRK